MRYKCEKCDYRTNNKQSYCVHGRKHKENYIEGIETALSKAVLSNKNNREKRILQYSLFPRLCLQCKTSISYDNRKQKFCNRSCSAIYNNSGQIREKISNLKTSEKLKVYWSSLSDKEKEIKTEIINAGVKKRRANNISLIMSTEWNELSYENMRMRVILEQNGACNKCGITHWNNERITLEFEHKDGVHENNIRDNVEALCPNCHSQTKTWRGRNENSISQKRICKLLEIK